METLDKLNEHTWATFVRPPVKFKDTPSTRKLIAEIMPYFPMSCNCIAGYLDDSDQFWKVNFHWELLVTMLRKALTLGVQTIQVQTLLNSMLSNPPNPVSGYRHSKVVGEPCDTSSCDLIRKRWATMDSVKSAFKRILVAERLAVRYPPSEPWDLSVAHVVTPGTSKHGCGYALDIAGHGMNRKIREIALSLGATLAYDEVSHVHVEFKQGVLFGRAPLPDNPHNGRYMGGLHARHHGKAAVEANAARP